MLFATSKIKSNYNDKEIIISKQNIPNSKSSFPSERSHLYSSFTVSVLNDQNPKLDKNNLNLIKTGFLIIVLLVIKILKRKR